MNQIQILFFVAFAVCVKAGVIHGGYDGGFDGGHLALAGGYGGGDSGHGHEDYNAHPKYNFNYAVHDPHTGDEKQHHEERDGDAVKGSYTLKEADGTTRVVEYKADKHNGFSAVVHKIGTPTHGHEGGGYGGHGHY